MKINLSYLIYKIKLKILCKLNLINKPSSILNNFFSSKFKKKLFR